MAKYVAAAVLVLACLGRSAHAGDGVDVLRYAPDDASFIVVVDVAAARTQPVFATLLAQAPLGGLIAVAAEAKVDLARDLDTIVVAATGAPGVMVDETFVLAGPGADPLGTYLLGQAAVTHQHGADYVRQGTQGLAHVPGALISTEGRDIEAALVAAARKRPGPSAARALLTEVDTHATAWSVAVLSPEQRATAARNLPGAKVVGATSSIQLGEDVAIEFRLVTEDPRSARLVKDWVVSRLPEVKATLVRLHAPALADLSVRLDGKRVRIAAKAPSAEVAVLLGAIARILAPAAPAPAPAGPRDSTIDSGDAPSDSSINCDDVLAGTTHPLAGAARATNRDIGPRTKGDANIQPPDADTVALSRAHRTRAIASVGVCLDPTGAVGSIGFVRKSGLPGWDRRICEQVRAWRYQPYLRDGQPVAVCTSVSFVYQFTAPAPAP